MERIKGFLWAGLSSSTFGLVPLFTLLLFAAGYSSFEVLTYRWGVASLCLTGYALLSGRSFRLRRGEFRAVLLLSLFRAATSLSLVIAYRNIASGAASTIHFIYPVAVALAMAVLFHERASRRTFAATAMSVAGAVLLSLGNADSAPGDALLGTLCAVASVFTYGGYIIGVRTSRAAGVDSTVLTCYVMAVGALLFAIGGGCTGGIRIETDPSVWLCILGLALPATAVSNMALVQAVKRIGPTLTSVLGALEPLTAVVLGIWLFAEPCTWAGVAGMVLIVVAVTVVVLDARSGGRPENS